MTVLYDDFLDRADTSGMYMRKSGAKILAFSNSTPRLRLQRPAEI